MVFKVKKACHINTEKLHTPAPPSRLDLGLLSCGPLKRQILMFQDFPLNSLLSENFNIFISLLRLDQCTVSTSRETALIFPLVSGLVKRRMIQSIEKILCKNTGRRCFPAVLLCYKHLLLCSLAWPGKPLGVGDNFVKCHCLLFGSDTWHPLAEFSLCF